MEAYSTGGRIYANVTELFDAISDRDWRRLLAWEATRRAWWQHRGHEVVGAESSGGAA
jgi:hypothetical protein